MRAAWAAAVVLALATSGGLTASAATPSLGKPPKQCDVATYEWLKSSTCLVQSRALTFTLFPKTLRPGQTVIAQAQVLFDSPGKGAAAVGWSWSSLEPVLGKRQGGCGPEKGSRPLVSRCRFTVSTPTGGWRTVQLSMGTFQGGAISRDYFAVTEDTITPAQPKPPKPEEKDPTLSVAIRLAGDAVLGEPTDGNVVVTAGEKPVSGIRFVGDVLDLAGTAIQLVEKPKPPGAFSLGAAKSRSFAFTVKGVAKGKATLRSAARGTSDGKTVSGAASLPVELADPALLVTLETKPTKLALEVGEDGKVEPKNVAVTVRLKNTSAKPLNQISVTGLFPQPVDPDSKADQLAFAKKAVPIAIGTLRPGQSVQRELELTVTGDGEYRIRALAQYAESATSRTQAAVGLGGRFEATVPPLWFEARLERAGLQRAQSASEGWIKAGGIALITGKVRNLSATKTLCLAPLYPKRSGNAGGTGPVDIARFGPDEIAPPVAGKIGPGDDILIGLWVRTAVDGSPRATIRFEPKAGVVGEDGECLATDRLASPLEPKQIRVKKGSGEFVLHVDVRDPVFSATAGEVFMEYYGGFMYGAAKGSADFFSATFASAAEMLSPQNLAKNALDPLGIYRGFALSIKTTELLVHYWENATPAERRDLYTRVSSVLGKARDDAWRKVRTNVDGAVDPWMNKLVVSYYKGDYRTVARTLGEGQGYTGAQVALSIAVAEIGNGLMRQLPRMSAAFKQIGDTTRTYNSLRALPPGKLLNLRELRNLYGIAAEDLAQLAAIARKHGVRIGVKGRSPQSIAELRRGSVWKPEPVKAKNVNAIDRDWLGFKSRKGIVATKKFSPAEREQILRKVANSNLSNEQKQAILDRFATRLQEEKALPDLQRMKARKRIDVGKNYRDNGLSPEDAPYESDVRRFDMSESKNAAGSTEYVPKMWNTSRGRMAEMTGDVDGLYIISANGTSLTARQHAAVLRDLWKTGWQHPETLTWIRRGEFEFASKGKILGEHSLGADAALEIGADGVARAVFVNLEQSLLIGPREFWLDVIGGLVAR